MRTRRKRIGLVARWVALLAAAATVALALVFGDRFGSDPGQVDSPLIGRMAPEVTLDKLDGSGSASLADLRGEIVVVNFFASWCIPCRFEHDDLVAAQNRYADEGVRFLGVVYQDSPASVTAFLDELGWGYDVLLDPQSAVAIEFGVFGIPETFFIDREGVIAAKIYGESDSGVIESILEPMLAGEQPDSRTTGTVQPSPDR